MAGHLGARPDPAPLRGLARGPAGAGGRRRAASGGIRPPVGHRLRAWVRARPAVLGAPAASARVRRCAARDGGARLLRPPRRLPRVSRAGRVADPAAALAGVVGRAAAWTLVVPLAAVTTHT